MADRSLKELDYAISFDINDNGLTKALNVENQLDKGLLGMATSAGKVDTNIIKIVSSTNKANTSTKGVAEALNSASTNAQKAGKNTDSINTSLSKSKSSAKGVSDAFKDITNSSTKSVDVVGKLKGALGALGTGVGVGAVSKETVNTYADFEQTMANLHATMGKISDSDFNSLWNAAVKAGAETKFNATEAGNALYYMASAGFEVKTSIESLNPLLNMAAAGGIQLDRASELLTASMTNLGLKTKDLTGFTDQLAVSAQKTNTDIDQLLVAINEVGGVARQANLATADLNAELGILSNSGKKGAEAGIGLRNVLLNLTAPNDQVAKLMKELKVNIVDATGKIRPLNDILVDLKEKMKPFNQGTQMGILETIGGKENIQSLSILLNGAGKDFETLKKQIEDSNGAAKEMAEIQNNTLTGAFKNLGSAIEGVQIKVMKDTGMGVWFKDLANEIAQDGPKVTNEIMYVSKVAGDFSKTIKDNWPTIKPVIAGVVGAFVAFKSVNGAMGIIKDFGKALKFLGTPAGGIFLVVAAVAALVGGIIYAYNTNEKFRNSINNLIVKFGEFYAFLQTYILPVLSVGFQGIWETIKKVWGDITQILSGVAEILGGVIDFVVGVFTGDWDKAWGGIKGIFTGVWDVISGTFKGFKDTIVGGLGTIIDMALKALKIFNDTNNAKPGDNSYLAWKAGVPESLNGTPKNMEQKSAQRAGKSGYAGGTNYATPGMHLVGENGPEILMFGGGEKVIPAGTTSSILNNSSDQYINSGKKMSNNIANGIESESNTIVKSLSNVLNTIKDTLSVFVQQSTTYGQNIINQITQGVTDSAVNLTTVVQSLTDKVVTTFKEGFGIHSPSRIMYSIGSFLMQGLVNGMSDKDVNVFLQDKIGSMIAVSTSAMGGNVSAWLTSALAATGTPLDWLPGLLKLVSAESGGDPNNWNPQSVGGEHATGLLQTLPSTFSEFMQPGMNNILNPVDNAASAINYIKSRYGSVYNTPLFRGGPYAGYANGTDNATPGLHLVGERGPEILAFNGGEKVLDNDKSKQIFNQSKPYASSNGSSAVIQSTPNIEINIQESKDAKTTAMEVEKILRKLFPQLFDKEMVKIGIQMGYTPIVES